MMVDTGTERNM